jgi:hypothetical protein
MTCALALRMVQFAATLAMLLARPAIVASQAIGATEAEDAARAPGLAALLHAAEPSLRLSGVPVLLPSRVPAVIGRVRSIAILLAGPSGYVAAFAPVRTCGGAQSCATVDIAGYAAPSHEAARQHDSHLRLPDGTLALFRPPDCSGASCTPSSLFFERKGTLYEIDTRTGRSDRAALVELYRALRPVLGTTVSTVKRGP